MADKTDAPARKRGKPFDAAPEDFRRGLEILDVTEVSANPIRRAVGTYVHFMHPSEQSDVAGVAVDLAVQCAKVERGNLTRLEHMLVAQAHTLDSIFHRMAGKASVAQDMPTMEALMRMALRAQSQARCAIEALTEIKFPKSIAFVHQANIAQTQQVNNDGAAAHVRPSLFPPNKLEGLTHEPAMDTRAASAAGRGDQIIEAVGTLDRPAQRRRQTARKP